MSKVPKTMCAMVLTGHGGLDKLEYHTDWPVPVAQENEALIKVHACGMNNTDINTRIGWYSKSVKDGTSAEGGAQGFEKINQDAATWGRNELKFPRIQGADVCGEVITVGGDKSHKLVGKRVLIDTWLRDWNDPLNLEKCGYYGSECNGGYAEYTTAPIKHVLPVNSDLSDAELATFATSSITAENMLAKANVGKDDVVLIPGASGGVGTALVQITRARGGTPIAMCGQGKMQTVKDLGAEHAIERSPADLKQALQQTINRETVDVVADVVGGPIWPQLIDVLKPGGRYTCAGAIAGPMVEFDLRTFYLKDLIFTGATVVAPDLFKTLIRRIENEEIKPQLARTFDLSELREAQTAFLAKKHVGNIVIQVS